MIEKSELCYVFKANNKNQRLYKRSIPLKTAIDALTKWNTLDKNEAGCLTKSQWQDRSSKWSYIKGWMLESTTGELEVLSC